VEVEARRALGAVRILVEPPDGVLLLSPASHAVSALAPGTMTTREILFRLPPGRERRTVEIGVEAELDEGIVRRATVLNILFDPEPHRVVMDPGGRTVREVRAERVGP
jgi:hypothetical protein